MKILLACFLIIFSLKPIDAAYTLKNFNYLLGKTPGLDAKLLEMHFQLYAGYVENTNKLFTLLNTLEKEGKQKTFEYGALKRRIGFEYDGIRLHELYFSNLGFTKQIEIAEPLYKQIQKDFGSFQAWKENFMATGLIRGIGWVILYRDPIQGKLVNVWVDEHQTNHLAGGSPLLVMDVWEHAYITEFGLNRAAYIDAFMKNINWDEVTKRFSEPAIMNRF